MRVSTSNATRTRQDSFPRGIHTLAGFPADTSTSWASFIVHCHPWVNILSSIAFEAHFSTPCICRGTTLLTLYTPGTAFGFLDGHPFISFTPTPMKRSWTYVLVWPELEIYRSFLPHRVAHLLGWEVDILPTQKTANEHNSD